MTTLGNILHLRASEFFGGPERAIIGQCRSLTTYRLTVASFSRRGAENRFLGECRSQGIPVESIPESFAGDFRVVGKLVRIIREQRIHLLVSHDYKANLFGWLAASRCGIRQAAHFRGRTAEDTKVRLYNFIDWQMLRRIPLVLVVSEPSKQLLVRHGVPAERIRVVFNAIECEPLPERDDTRGGTRPIEVVVAGRLSFEKGHDVLWKAVASIKDRAPAFRVSVYGHGPEEHNLRQLAADLGIESIVHLCGFVDDIKPILREADLMVLPSRSEGMPNVILEAWSQGLGVLSTAVGGVPDMIVDGDSGLLVESDNPEALGLKLLAALNDPALVREYGRRGREVVMDRYNYGCQAELLESIYGEYLGRSR